VHSEVPVREGAAVDISCFRGAELYLPSLQQAVSSSNMSMVDLLIEKGVDANKVTSHLGGAIQTARYDADKPVMERFRAAGRALH
jgi:hypothetical protein